MAFKDLDIDDKDFSVLKLVGLDNWIFLNNDSNYELRQHYAENFKNKFDEDKFRKSFNSKKNFCQKNNIQYKFYVVPDKSVVCKEYLPITPKSLKRNYDSISDLAQDFIDNLTPDDYFQTDSHLNYNGGIKYSAKIMHDLNNKVSYEDYLEAIKENMTHKKVYYPGDLYQFRNPSNENMEIADYYEFIHPEYSFYEYSDEDMTISEEFKYNGKRASEYIKNRFSLTDKKCLILRDSTTNRLLHPLNVFFKSIFAYWDHWNFNKELIEWYKPDIIMEIRTERFLEKMKYEIIE